MPVLREAPAEHGDAGMISALARLPAACAPRGTCGGPLWLWLAYFGVLFTALIIGVIVVIRRQGGRF